MSQNFRSRALASVAAVAIVASGAVGAALYEGQPALAQTAKAPITVNAQAPATFADVVEGVLAQREFSLRKRSHRTSDCVN